MIACADSENDLFTRSAIDRDLFYQALVFDTHTVTGSPTPTVNSTYHNHHPRQQGDLPDGCLTDVPYR